MEAKAKRTRVVGSKYSKKGCRTCRIRKVKCDEARPSCRNCVSTGRTCDGYSADTTSNRAVASKRPLLPSPPTSSPVAIAITPPPSCLTFSTTASDQNSFQFFVQNMALGLSFVTPGKWIGFALQLAMTEPALYYAVSAVGGIAISSFDKNYHKLLKPPAPMKRGPSLQQYCKATALLQRYIDDAMCRKAGVEPILLCCLFFVLYEVYQGETSLALSHLRLGRRVIEDNILGLCRDGSQSKPLQCSSPHAVNEIMVTFDFLDIESAHFDRAALAPKASSKSLNGFSTKFISVEHAKEVLDSIVTASSHWQSELVRLAEEHVTKANLADLRPCVKSCIAHCLSRSMNLPPGHFLLRRQAKIMRDHEEWLSAVMKLQKLQGHVVRRRVILMMLQHFSSSFYLQTCRETEESLTDRFKDQFTRVIELVDEYMINLGPQPPKPSQKGLNPYQPFPQHQEYYGSSQNLSLEYAILPALFLVCLKCRDPNIRRRALHLLRTMNRREGRQWSGEWGHYADSIIVLEESLASDDSSGNIPESARVMDIIIEICGFLQLKMVCGRFRHEGDGRLEVVEYGGAGEPPLRLTRLVEHVFPFRALESKQDKALV